MAFYCVVCICEGVECVLGIADPQIALGCDLSGLMVGITARRMRPPLCYANLNMIPCMWEILTVKLWGHFDFSFPVTVIAR